MKNLINFSLVFTLILGVSACSTADTSKNPANESVKNAMHFTAEGKGLALKWTAYKFTEKLGVSGTFDDIDLTLKNDAGSIDKILSGATMTISTSSVNSKNEIRDPKLINSFFKVFNTEVIDARIIDAEDGEGTLEIKMNGIATDVNYDYMLKHDTLFLNSHIDMLDWNGKVAMDSLNLVCYDLHKGADGVSKLWPDVMVNVILPVQSQH